MAGVAGGCAGGSWLCPPQPQRAACARSLTRRLSRALGPAAAALRHPERDAADRLPSTVDEYELAISLCGLSKSWALPGLRMGWVACKDRELLEQVGGWVFVWGGGGCARCVC